jgi:hypothetical protein
MSNDASYPGFLTQSGKVLTDADVDHMAEEECWQRQRETGERCDVHPLPVGAEAPWVVMQTVDAHSLEVISRERLSVHCFKEDGVIRPALRAFGEDLESVMISTRRTVFIYTPSYDAD